MAKDRPTPEPLSDEEIRLLASIIVYDAECTPVYSADETALALIRLVAGVAAAVADKEDKRTPEDVLFCVTLGAFGNTEAYGGALDGFADRALQLDINQLAKKGGRE